MNNQANDTQLENLLLSLVPSPPSPELTHQVEEELKLDMSWLNAKARPRRNVNWLSSAGWSSLGAAAAVAVMSFLPSQPQGTFQSGITTIAATSPPAKLPVSSTISEWEDSTAHRPEHYATVSTRGNHTWLNPRDRARITLDYTHEEKLALPVNFLSDTAVPLSGMLLYEP